MSDSQELPELPQIEFADRSSDGPWKTAIKRLFRQHSGIAGMILLGLLVLTAIFASVIAPYDPNEVLIGKEDVRKRQPPCIHVLGCPADQPQHIMGIDGNVRDEFSRIVYGSRISIFIGFVTIGFAIVVGTILGTIAGYTGGLTANVIMRTLDVVLAFPFLLLAIAIVAMLGPGLVNAMMAIAIVNIPTYARVIRSSVLSVREEEYITAAILETAGLSFLGLGAQPPDPEWGAMLASERNQVFSAPHLVFFPGLAIMVTVLGFNLLGDGLRDALDPRLRL